MQFDFTLRSSVLLIFFVHGLVFSGLLLTKGFRNQNKSDVWLSIFIFLCVMYISPFMLGYAGWYTFLPYRDIMFYLPLQQLFLIGPVIFFYAQSLLNKSFKLSKKDFVHFVPAILYLIYSVIIFVTDKIILGEYYFYADGRDKDLAFWYQISGLISMAFYLILSLRIYKIYKDITYQVVSFADKILFGWIQRFLISFLIILILRVLFFILNPEWGAFGSKFWYYLSFSISFYYISINGYFNSVKTVIAFQAPLLGKDSKFNLNEDVGCKKDELNIHNEIYIDEPTARERVEIENIDEWKRAVEQLIKHENSYENPELTLNHISESLEISPKKLSQIINQGFNMNFNDFINFYRTQAVIEKFQSGLHNVQSLLEIAFDCGFNSKSTFNRAFKKQTKLTPKEFIKKYHPK